LTGGPRNGRSFQRMQCRSATLVRGAPTWVSDSTTGCANVPTLSPQGFLRAVRNPSTPFGCGARHSLARNSSLTTPAGRRHRHPQSHIAPSLHHAVPPSSPPPIQRIFHDHPVQRTSPVQGASRCYRPSRSSLSSLRNCMQPSPRLRRDLSCPSAFRHRA